MKLFVRRHLDVLWRALFSLGLVILAVSCSSQFPTVPPDPFTHVPSTSLSEAIPPPSATLISPTLTATTTTSRVPVTIATPLPTETARVSPAIPSSPNRNAGDQLTITLADDGKTIPLGNGQAFLLSLGGDFVWSVDVADQTVLGRVPNITVVKEAQGVYKANKLGTTALHAHGTIICPPLRVCAEVIKEFQVQVVVK